jgi:heme exporter protein D
VTEVSPAERTVGQLIADAIKLYGHRFWRGLGLGIPAAAFTIGASFLDGGARIGYGVVVGPFALALSYVLAVDVATGARDARVRALLVGAVAFLPLAASRVLVFTGVYFVALAWFALVGLAVPSVLVEGRGLRDALQHGFRLARADFVHAFGTVAALAIVVIVSIFSLSLLLAGFGAQSVTVSAVMAVIVMSPLFFVGCALLYVDQKARLESGSPRRRRRDARLHHAVEPDRAGRADAEVEPGPAARGEP